MADDLLKLKWNGHITSFLDIFQSLRAKSRYTDVTLACEGRLFTVHRLVLASCSQFFDHIFEQTPSDNTVIVLNEAKAHDIEALLDYMYCGQVDVQQSDLSSFIRTAKCLQIKGLAPPGEVESYHNEEDKRILDSPSRKRRRSNCSSPMTNHSQKNVSKTPLSTNRSTPKSSTAASSSLVQNCWVFQQSDLPNTTWSTSPNSKVEDGGTEKENATPPQEFKENNLRRQSNNRNLVIDESPSRNSPHSNPLSSFRYSSNLPVSSDINSSCRRTEDGSQITNKYYHQSPDCSEEPLHFKKEIKDEDDDRSINEPENDESHNEYETNNYSRILEYDNSSEVFGNYVHQFSEPSSTPPFDKQSFINPRISSQERNILPLKFVKKTVPVTLPSSVWRNCPTNAMSISEQDSCAHPVISGGSSQSTVSPKLLPYAKCSNCHTNNTKLWRRSMQGEIVCNACGLYFKLHGTARPSHLFRNAPMTRRRNPGKKKRSYEEILDGREPPPSTEELNDSIYSETGCDSETQEGLAMLNAALTLNSLLAKAKAQEAANKNLELHQSQSSSVGIGCDSSSVTNDSLPPPPPLLKISLHSGVVSTAAHKPPSASSSSFSQENHSSGKVDDQNTANSNECPQPMDSESHNSDYEDPCSESSLT